jgi:catechol 2,3-dioxygenase-like lactoylglutathione lyase family enzyme
VRGSGVTDSTQAPRAWPENLPVRQVRVARPTDRLEAVTSFYRDGLGLAELFRFEDHDGYSGIMLGLPGAAYHLEFTHHAGGSPGQAPTRDNLLVLYFDGDDAVREVARRLAAHGGTTAVAENPYWTSRGAITIEDPDGWRVVLVPQPVF